MSEDRLKALEMLVDDHSKRLQIAETDNTNLCTILRFMAGSRVTFYALGDTADKAADGEKVNPGSYLNLDMLYIEIVKLNTMLRTMLGEEAYDELDKAIEGLLPIRLDTPVDPSEGLAKYLLNMIEPDVKRHEEERRREHE